MLFPSYLRVFHLLVILPRFPSLASLSLPNASGSKKPLSLATHTLAFPPTPLAPTTISRTTKPSSSFSLYAYILLSLSLLPFFHTYISLFLKFPHPLFFRQLSFTSPPFFYNINMLISCIFSPCLPTGESVLHPPSLEDNFEHCDTLILQYYVLTPLLLLIVHVVHPCMSMLTLVILWLVMEAS